MTTLASASKEKDILSILRELDTPDTGALKPKDKPVDKEKKSDLPDPEPIKESLLGKKTMLALLEGKGYLKNEEVKPHIERIDNLLAKIDELEDLDKIIEELS